MTEYIFRRKYKVFGMDIESHNDEESIRTRTTGCWLGCFLDENSKMDDPGSYFYSIYEFLQRIREESKNKRGKKKEHLCKNVCVYIYNLSFEWSFILPVLLSWGFSYDAKIGTTSSMVYNSVSTKSCSSVWCAQLKFEESGGFVIFRDLAKMFPGGLGAVAKAFGLETQKGEIDYRKDRRGNYTPTAEEHEYCFKDTRIIVEILLKMQGDKDFWNSSSMASYSMRKLIKRGFPKTYNPYRFYRMYYPELGKSENDFLRLGVGGGITYAPDRWQFRTVTEKVAHIDFHQMHPSSAYLNQFPYGKGEYFFGNPPISKICACRIRIRYTGVKLHSVIKLIGLPFIDGMELVVWNFEIPVMRQCYENLEIEYIDGYAYKHMRLPWREYYATNYRKRLIAKKNKDAFNTLYYKLLNNASYGKHLEKPDLYFGLGTAP